MKSSGVRYRAEVQCSKTLQTGSSVQQQRGLKQCRRVLLGRKWRIQYFRSEEKPNTRGVVLRRIMGSLGRRLSV